MICERIFKLPEQHLKYIYEELLLLVKYGNFSREDVRSMSILERKYNLDKLIEWQERKKV